MVSRFFQVLFDEDQSTCFAFEPKGTRVRPVREADKEILFSINALHPTKDLDPTEPYHSHDRPRRADHNVICFRNVLVEMDKGTFAEQMDLMTSTQLPWSTCVWSGGKSLHFIISFEKALSDRLLYGETVKRIYKALSNHIEIDPANKNPSRLSRVPNAWRADKRNIQRLVAVKDRISNSEIETWLRTHGAAPEMTPPHPRASVLSFPERKTLSRFTRDFLKQGAPEGQWNQSLFRAACDLVSCGASLDEATAQLQRVTGTLDRSDLATIKSAYRRASRGA